MGWSFATVDIGRKAHIEELTKGFTAGYTSLEHRAVGNHVWQLIQAADGRKFIHLDLIAKERGYGWGNKSMSETAGPCYYDCPLSFLDKADPPTGYAIEWREKVRAYHAAKKAAKPVAGAVVQINGEDYTLVRPAGPRRGWIVTDCNGTQWRVNAKRLAQAKPAPATP
jgi:hypothetical protein